MKNIFNYIVFVAVMLATASCVEPLDSSFSGQEQSLTLSFSCGIMTKADENPTQAGVGNENLIKEIKFFVFPLNSEGKVDDNAEYVFTDTVTPEDNGLGLTYTKTIKHSDLLTIFSGGKTKAMLFAVANYVDEYGSAGAAHDAHPDFEPKTTLPETATTWKALHELEVGPTFFYDDQNPDFLLRWPRKMNPNDDDLFFVMTGEKEIVLKPSAEGDNLIPLKRLASKVTVKLRFGDPIVDDRGTSNTDDDITWVPQPSGDETRVFLSNAIEHTTLGGPLTRTLVGDGWGTATMPLGDGTRDIFEYAYDFLKTDVTTTDEDGNKIAHYYTYPISMDKGDDNQPYLKLVLPWYGYKDYGTSNERFYKQKEVYYKIVIPSATVNEGNRIYEYTVDVNIINNDKDVSIDGDYVVKDWLYNNPISTNVATGRYISLDIPKDEYDMYVNLIDIAFVSSGKVKVIVDEIYQLDLHGSSPVEQYFMQNDRVTASNDLRTKKGIATGEAGDNVIKSWVTIPENTSYLRINHTMDNRMNVTNQQGTSVQNTAFDMSPYVFKVTLHLEDAGNDTSFDRHVTITQYPSMYVTSVKSSGLSGNVWVNNTTYTSNTANSNPPSTSVNNSSNQNIGSVAQQSSALSTSNNNNGYNMIVHPTVLDASLNLQIGDSRVQEGSTRSTINGLTNYRATRTDISRIVSPGFMIASSYGKTTDLSTIGRAVDRCASYQENGYPAGRWRVPTEGEIEFLVKLSEYGFIPSLFDGSYWAASGRAYNSSSKTFVNGSSGPVRCIYDTWYWGEEPYQANATTWLGFRD